MKRFATLFVLVVLLAALPGLVWGVPLPVQEPDLANAMGWDLAPSGLLVVDFDRDGNGRADYLTLRFVVRAYPSAESVATIAGIWPDNLVFFVDYEWDCYFYIAAPQPLFYVFDTDEDGHWDLMYKDVMEDGVNGNEQFYDSPSGKFAPE